MRPTKHASTLLECANKLYTDGQLCDTVLKVGGKQIYVHRLVLTAFSAYFEALIQSNPGTKRDSIFPSFFFMKIYIMGPLIKLVFKLKM